MLRDYPARPFSRGHDHDQSPGRHAGRPPASSGFSAVQAEAHKLAFYPMIFQAVRSLLRLGILDFLLKRRKSGASKEEIVKARKVSVYAASLLLELEERMGIVTEKDGLYRIGCLGMYLYADKSVLINMDFMHDACYQGAFFLEESFRTGKPEGLKVFGD